MTTLPTTRDERSHPPGWTDETFRERPDDGRRYEVVGDRLVEKEYLGFNSGCLCTFLGAILGSYVVPKKWGIVVNSSTAFKMGNGNKRSPANPTLFLSETPY